MDAREDRWTLTDADWAVYFDDAPARNEFDDYSEWCRACDEEDVCPAGLHRAGTCSCEQDGAAADRDYPY